MSLARHTKPMRRAEWLTRQNARACTEKGQPCLALEDSGQADPYGPTIANVSDFSRESLNLNFNMNYSNCQR